MGNFLKFNLNSISRIKYRKDINGLRGIAVLSVVLFHADIGFFSGGYLGVDIFFVISGYLISNIIISDLNNNIFSFKNFYLKRIRRIVPALISTILISIPLSYWLVTPKAMIEFLKSSIASLFLFSNFYFQNLDFYHTEPTKLMPLLHTWSLSIEEQFYLIFPIISFIFYRYHKKLFTLYLTFFLILSLYSNSLTSDLSKFYQIKFRAWELLLGVLVMIINKRYSFKKLNYLGLLVLLISFNIFENDMLTLNSIEPKLTVCFGTILFLLSDKTKLERILNNNLLQYIGNISYSLYLFHQPFFAFLRNYEKKYAVYIDVKFYYLAIFLLIFFSYLNWKYVEQYFKKTSISKLFLLIILSIITIFIYCFLGIRSDGFKNRYEGISDEILFFSTNKIIYPTTQELENFNDFCISDDKQELYIIGDSHAYTFAYTFITEYKELSCDYNLKIASGDAGRCLLSQQSDTVGYIGWCTDETFEKFIEDLKAEPTKIIAIGRFDTWLNPSKAELELKCNDCNFKNVFQSRIEKISKNIESIIVISPVPTYPFDITEAYLYGRVKTSKDITIDLSEWSEYINTTKEFFINLDTNNLTILNSEEVFCDYKLDSCFGSKEGKIYYSDDNHLTITGSKLLINKLLKILE